MKFLNWIKTSFYADRDSWILWLPVFFGLGIIFYFYFPNNSFSLPALLIFSSFFLIFIFREKLWSLLIIVVTIFLLGFVWAKFYTETIAYTPKIEYKFYATAIGKIDDINSFYNPILKRNAYQMVLRDVHLYKAGSLADDVIVKKIKAKKVKKIKKKKPKKPKKESRKKSKNAEPIDAQDTVSDDQKVTDKNQSEEPKKKRRRRKKKILEEPESQEQQTTEQVSADQNPATANANENLEIKPTENLVKKKRKRKKKSTEEVVDQEKNEEQIIATENQDNSSAKQDKKLNKKSKKLKKPRPKKSKRENKTVLKSYLNVDGYQEIDREFLAIDYKSQNQNWINDKYQNPPSKLLLNVNTHLGDAKIGEVIQSRVVLEPFKKPYLEGGYNVGFNNYFKGIGGSGYAASDLKILKSHTENGFLQDVRILRQKIAKKILDQTDEKSGGIAVALLVGSQNFISSDIMNDVRNSGLAHLLSISGLHFTLAAGIFFFSIRFFLSLNQYLVLNFDIKKISALIAIFTGLFYLLLADMPVPAVRSFIVIALVFIAILLDLKPDTFRSTAFAALAILIFSPYAIFSVSFQLSFAAIIALIVLADFSKKYQINSSERPFYLKFCFYFLGIVASSIAATIATTPFSIYYFNNFISYGALANLVVIPIASFVTMPCGFLALLLMPLGIEKLALMPMQISIGWIVDIARYTASLPHSYLAVKAISVGSFALIIFGGLWFCLWKKSWRILGLVPIILGIYFASQTPLPHFLVDEQRKMFAFYEDEKLVFLKPSKSKQAKVWAKRMGLNEFYNINDLSEEEKQKLQLNCDQNLCELQLQKNLTERQHILILNGRNQIDEICQKNSDQKYDLIINLNKKYRVPECLE